MRQFLLKNLTRKPEGGFEWKLNLRVIDSNLERIGGGLIYSGKFEKNTLFIRGTKSSYILEEDKATIREIFPKATIVELDAGHWVQAEMPTEFVTVVKNFLNTLS